MRQATRSLSLRFSEWVRTFGGMLRQIYFSVEMIAQCNRSVNDTTFWGEVPPIRWLRLRTARLPVAFGRRRCCAG